MWIGAVLTLVIVVYNNVVNRWKPFHGPAYVPVNLAFAAIVVAFAMTALDLTYADIGLRGDLADVTVSVGLIAIFGVAAFAFAGSRHGHRITDRRVEGMAGSGLAFYVLLRIPIGTAVTEEILFRGLLFAAWRNAADSTALAVLLASVAFGLWHVEPTIIGVRMNDPEANAQKMRLAVVGAVILTAVAGIGLTWLRLESGGVLAPILVHGGVNSVAALAAVFAHRKADRRRLPRARST